MRGIYARNHRKIYITRCSSEKRSFDCNQMAIYSHDFTTKWPKAKWLTATRLTVPYAVRTCAPTINWPRSHWQSRNEFKKRKLFCGIPAMSSRFDWLLASDWCKSDVFIHFSSDIRVQRVGCSLDLFVIASVSHTILDKITIKSIDMICYSSSSHSHQLFLPPAFPVRKSDNSQHLFCSEQDVRRPHGSTQFIHSIN